MDTFRRKFGLDGLSEATASTSIPMPTRNSSSSSSGSRLYPVLPSEEALDNDDPDLQHHDRTGTGDSSDVKQKLRSMWHNVKYGRAAWTLQDNGAVLAGERGPVWMMGRCYDRRRGRARDEEEARRSRRQYQHQRSWPKEHHHQHLIHEQQVQRQLRQQHPRFSSDDAVQAAFHADFATRPWFTYRREFAEFRGTTMNTDCGWGCMIRSGQMILGNTLLLQRFGRSWRWKGGGGGGGVGGTTANGASGSPVTASRQMAQDDKLHRSVLRLFGDCPDVSVAPMSIHNLVAIADEILGRQPGDWFGPASTAHLLREAAHRSTHPLLDSLCVYVSRDCTVFRQDVRDLCRDHREKRRRQKRRSGSSETPAAAEDFSVLEVPSEYPTGLIPLEAVGDAVRLAGGVVDGVPYVVEASEAEEESGFGVVSPREGERTVMKNNLASSPPPVGFTLLSDGTENYSLNQSLYVEGEQWTVEGRAAMDHHHRHRAGGEVEAVVTAVPSNDNDDVAISETLSPEGDWTPVLLLVPLRLGRDRLNVSYSPVLREAMTRPECVGVIGGRPRHSLYFVGFQDENLVHMDPHLVQDHVDVFRPRFPVESFHCKTPRKMHISKMDPSCCIGFYFQTRASFESWCEEVRSGECGGGAYGYPMFAVSEGRAADADAAAEASVLMAASMTASTTSDDGRRSSASLEDVSEDFVFL